MYPLIHFWVQNNYFGSAHDGHQQRIQLAEKQVNWSGNGRKKSQLEWSEFLPLQLTFFSAITFTTPVDFFFRTLHNTLCAATAMRSTTKTRQSQHWTSWMPPVSGTMSSAEDASRQTPAGSKYTAIPTAFPGRAIPDMTLQVRACPVFSCTRRSMVAPYSQLHVSGDPVIGPLCLFSDLLTHHPHTQLRPARRRSPMRL